MKNKKPRMPMIFLALILACGEVNCVMESIDRDVEELQQGWNRAEVVVNVEEVQGELDEVRRQEALEKLREILGIRGKLKEENRKEIPPQFMMELYNTVTDSAGLTRGNNPYNAKVVRSFIEKDSSSMHFYIFNISGLEQNEAVLEAELHLYRKRTPPKAMHPSLLSSPYYLIKIYQVLPDQSLDEPDLHRLLNVHYVGAYTSGWQVFNVKEAVLSWLSGAPNLGLLVTATTIFGDKVTVEFSRRDDLPRDKQPILVLFNDDSADNLLDVHPPRDRAFEDEDAEAENDEFDDGEMQMESQMMMESERSRSKRHGRRGQMEEAPDHVENNRPARFHREKKERRVKPRDENEIRPRKTHGFVTRRKSLEQTLTSMDIYQRALLREKLDHQKESGAPPRSEQKIPRSRRDAAAPSSTTEAAAVAAAVECRKVETEPCAKRELYVNFREIGLTNIIAPEGYAAYQCRGHCQSPLSQDQKPTNHATIQGIIQKMKLAQNEDVQMPQCVPVNLSSISILYRDDNKDGIVLKSYTDMAVVSCGCR